METTIHFNLLVETTTILLAILIITIIDLILVTVIIIYNIAIIISISIFFFIFYLKFICFTYLVILQYYYYSISNLAVMVVFLIIYLNFPIIFNQFFHHLFALHLDFQNVIHYYLLFMSIQYLINLKIILNLQNPLKIFKKMLNELLRNAIDL